MQKKLTIGRTYAVTTATTCDVTDANGTLITTATAGQQVVFVAPTTTITFSDDSAAVVAVFKLALAKTRLFEQLGEGKLPAGYLPALFLENTETSYIKTSLKQTQSSGCRIVCTAPPSNKGTFLLLAGNEAFVPLMYYRGNGTEVIGYAANGSKYPQKDGTTATSGWNALKNGYAPAENISVELNYRNSGKWIADNGGEILERDVSFSTVSYKFYLFARNYLDSVPGESYFYGWPAKIYTAIFTEGAEVTRNYIPSVDINGVPCMFDRVTWQAFYNVGTGAFIVGMTVAQARKLWQLPADAEKKTLTISLPTSAFVDLETGEIADAAVNAALVQAEANGWTITIQTYTE